MKSQFENISLTNVKGVLIDIDNTLYSYDKPHHEALAASYKQTLNYDVDLSQVDFNKLYRKYRTEVTERLSPQGACRSRLFAFMQIFEELKIRESYVKAYHLEKIYWDTFINNMLINKAANNFLTHCKEKELKVCAVTDMQTHFQVIKLKALGLVEFINYLATSEEAGAEKPHPAIFEMALKKLNLSTKDVIMIGDDLLKDIKGAENIGIKAYQVIV